MAKEPGGGAGSKEPDIGHWLRHHTSFQGTKAAIVFEGETITYAMLDGRADAVAHYLVREHGLGVGDRVAYLGLNHPAMIALLFACARIGAILVPLNWRLTPAELGYMLADCGPKVLFHDDAHADIAGTLATETPELATCGIGDLEAPEAGPFPETGNLNDPLLIVYTSGTTGRPKGAVLAQRALLANALNSADMHKLDKTDTLLVVLPLFHVGGLNIQFTPALYVGATVHLHARFEPRAVLDAVRDLEPELMVLVPATMDAVRAEAAWETTDFSCLRMLSTGSTIVPVELIAAFEARGISIVQVYGSTETCPIATYQRPGDCATRPRSSGGPALLSELRIVDEAGAPIVEPDQQGEISVRGDHVMEGYWNNPEATSAVMQDGWFATGDIGSIGTDGELYFRDRKSNVIISGGENVYPAEIERVLSSLESIDEAAVVGVPDARWGEVPVAALVCAREAPGEEAVRALLDAELARYKHPKQFVVLEALPRNAMGKVVAAEVREHVLTHLARKET
jgi:fatty-acyl-CoA synthase